MKNIFLQSYITTALWSSLDDQDQPLDDKYSIDDIDAESLKKLESMCEEFQAKNKDDISLALDVTDLGHIAHDFWLTQNRHGAGFWDGDYAKDLGERLTTASHKIGEVDLYVGDDGKLYI